MYIQLLQSDGIFSPWGIRYIKSGHGIFILVMAVKNDVILKLFRKIPPTQISFTISSQPPSFFINHVQDFPNPYTFIFTTLPKESNVHSTLWEKLLNYPA